MGERIATLIFFTCRHIRAYSSVIIFSEQQKFFEKTNLFRTGFEPASPDPRTDALTTISWNDTLQNTYINFMFYPVNNSMRLSVRHSKFKLQLLLQPGFESIPCILLRHVQAPCGIWTRAAVYSYMSGNGAAGWAMRELLVSLVFSTCRHIRAFATVIIYTIKQKFLEKTLWLFMVSNPNLQVHGPTLWPLYHAIPWTIPNNTITIFYRQKFICFRQTRFDPTRDMKEKRRNIWNNSHNFKLNL